MHRPTKTYFKLFIFILFLVLFGLGCGNVPSSSTSSPPDTESETEPPDVPADVTSTATPLRLDSTATITPSPPEEPTLGPPVGPTLPPPVINPSAAIPHLNPGQDVIISYIDMQDAASGWAVGGTADPGGHVLRTSDGGTTWQDVTPPEPDSEPGEPRKIAEAFFMDNNNAWVTFSFASFFTTPTDVIVWRTTNGGSTWTSSAYLDTGGMMEIFAPTFLYFVDAFNGWYLVSVGAGMSHDYSIFFRTNNGGATWTRIAHPSESVDMQSCCKTGMAFADTNTGMVTYEQGPYTSVYVEWTYDGGLTWSFSDLPSPPSDPGYFETVYCEAHSPTFFSTLSVTIGVTCREWVEGGPSIYTHFVYRTTDGGATWLSYPYPGGDLLFIDANLVMATTTSFGSSEEISKSADGGMTWVIVKTVIWDGQFSFASEMVGWAVARDEPEIALVMTSDGGSSWAILEPVIGP